MLLIVVQDIKYKKFLPILYRDCLMFLRCKFTKYDVLSSRYHLLELSFCNTGNTKYIHISNYKNKGGQQIRIYFNMQSLWVMKFTPSARNYIDRGSKYGWFSAPIVIAFFRSSIYSRWCCTYSEISNIIRT